MNKVANDRSLSARSQPGRNRKGLVLLMALGMLALFSLLAVTWVVSASSSRTGAKAMQVRANHSGTSVRGMSQEVLKMALRGTRDQKSAFHQHALLEDIYESNGTRGVFRTAGNNFELNWCRKLTPAGGNPILGPVELMTTKLLTLQHLVVTKV